MNDKIDVNIEYDNELLSVTDAIIRLMIYGLEDKIAEKDEQSEFHE